MTHDELLARIDEDEKFLEQYFGGKFKGQSALRAVVELAMKPVDASNIPAAQVAWFYEGYNLALDNVVDAIEKELG